MAFQRLLHAAFFVSVRIPRYLPTSGYVHPAKQSLRFSVRSLFLRKGGELPFPLLPLFKPESPIHHSELAFLSFFLFFVFFFLLFYGTMETGPRHWLGMEEGSEEESSLARSRRRSLRARMAGRRIATCMHACNCLSPSLRGDQIRVSCGLKPLEEEEEHAAILRWHGMHSSILYHR